VASVRVEAHEKIQGVYWVTLEHEGKRLATVNLTPGRAVYGERLLTRKNVEYRLWDPYRSKLAAAIVKGVDAIPIKPHVKVLYLGAASGTTASHVSDIVEHGGLVYCVEFAPRAMRELVDNVCAHRPNMHPISADARFPERYRAMVQRVDAVYCDIAQPEQAKVLADNAETYLKPRGGVMLAIKARSVDVTKTPSSVFKSEVEVLKQRGIAIQKVVRLEPYEKDHAMVIGAY